MHSRLYQYDYLRFYGVLFIIGIHSSDLINHTANLHSSLWWFGNFFQTIVRTGLPVFFMVSGALLLNSKEEGLKSFYLRRFSKIAIPLFIFSYFYLFIYKYRWHLFQPHNLLVGLKTIVNGPVYGHLWFVYAILGLYIATPFIKAMVKHLSDSMLMGLLLTYVIIFTLRIYVPFHIGITDLSFDNWIFYFLLGYALTRPSFSKKEKSIYWLGLISFLLTLIILRFLPQYETNIYALSPTMAILASSMFLLFYNHNTRFNPSNYFQRFQLTVSKYSYSLYLIHAYILFTVVNKHLKINALTFNPVVGLVLTICITFVISLIVAMFMDNLIINPLMKLITPKRKLETADTLAKSVVNN